MTDAAETPRVGCAAVVFRDDKVMLGCSNNPGYAGAWVLPGGGVNFGERLVDTVQREIKEETGLTVILGDIITVDEIIKPNKHRIIVYMQAEARLGEPVPSSDLSEVEFFTQDQVRQLHIDGKADDLVMRVLEKSGWLV